MIHDPRTRTPTLDQLPRIASEVWYAMSKTRKMTMTHVPNSVLSKPPAELGSGPESNPIAKAAAAESVRQAQGESGFSSATGMAARAPVRSERVDTRL